MITHVTELLDRSAQAFPNRTALSDESTSMTYAELSDAVMRIATFIVKEGLSRKPIAICMEKSAHEIAAFLGVAYASCFYTPIDSSMPPARVSRILETLEPALTIVTDETRALIENSSHAGTVVNFKTCLSCEADVSAARRARSCSVDVDPLYVLFTSGSTGVPKGVTICHRSVIDYVYRIRDVFGLDETTVFGNQAPFYFDNSVLDIYTSLLVGGQVHVIPPKLFAWPVPLLKHLAEHKVNLIFWVPSALVAVANLKALAKVDLSNISHVLFAGEAMPAKQLNMWRRAIPAATFANLYGPTEITDCCTYFIVDRELSDTATVPIGNAFVNSDVLVLDENDQLVSPTDVSTTGELCVRGSSLSLGYYGNPKRTAEAFVQNPLNDKYPDIIYRTGDLVKYNQFGEIEFLSRIDHQIKISGNRVELGEIEAAAVGVAGVMECCCIFDEKRGQLMLVYAGKADTEDVRAGIANAVSPYMVPARYERIASMPHNLNGKIDRAEAAARCLGAAK